MTVNILLTNLHFSHQLDIKPILNCVEFDIFTQIYINYFSNLFVTKTKNQAGDQKLANL